MKPIVYTAIICLLVSIGFLACVLISHYTSFHNIDMSFNGLSDVSKIDTAIDYYAVNKTDESLISRPLINFYIDGMDYIHASPILFIAGGVIFGMSLMVIIYELNNMELKEKKK